MQDTIVVILGGGQGTRLYPLTRVRSKPAVPIAGKYRLIDIPVSNSINSGLKKIFILTQFNSQSLNSHVTRTYRFDPFSEGSVEILAAEQTEEYGDWYQGTADAVRKHLHRFIKGGVKHILILGGDHLYRMDYRKLIEFHEARNADITVSTIPVRREAVSGFGVLKMETDGRITEFFEKPKTPEQQARMQLSSETMSRLGLEDNERPFLASMGIYVFNPRMLEQVLSDKTRMDFGHDIIPHAIHTHPVYGYVFDDYWEDIGTIRAFFDANVNLGEPSPNFHFYRPDAPIYTRPRYLPGSKLYDCRVHHSVISDGCLIRDSVIEHSIVGLRTRINTGTTIKWCVLMGADYYEMADESEKARVEGIPPLGIGENCHIERAIIDKNARIGNNVIIRNERGIQHADGSCYFIRDGIVVIPKEGIVPDGTVV
jgi:glucose-1-phosphate adenylyltransferase